MSTTHNRPSTPDWGKLDESDYLPKHQDRSQVIISERGGITFAINEDLGKKEEWIQFDEEIAVPVEE